VRLLDVNLFLYAVDETSPRHDAAAAWVEAILSDTETLALAWTVLLAFVRLSTHPAVFVKPLGADEALDLVDEWLDQPCTTVVDPTARHSSIMRELLRSVGTAGNLTSDAHLATLAIEHGAELYSCDADFSRFPGLRWVNPLIS
jgi:toxin-antitoxin system PIN domain toxin